jgi:hypothetical protein
MKNNGKEISYFVTLKVKPHLSDYYSTHGTLNQALVFAERAYVGKYISITLNADRGGKKITKIPYENLRNLVANSKKVDYKEIEKSELEKIEKYILDLLFPQLSFRFE